MIGGTSSSSRGRRWAIVLSGGEGERMRSLIRRLYGESRPKQYCTFIGTRSMLQHTLDRARQLVPERCILTVIAAHHERFFQDATRAETAGWLIRQPQNCGTAPGVFLPAAYIRASDPEATVLVFPSDHYVHPESAFVDTVREAIEIAESRPDRLVLLGAVPDRPETDYGWIVPRRVPATDGYGAARRRALPVAGFHEKPHESVARRLFERGCQWNTMVLIGKLKTLWSAGRMHLSEMMLRFEALCSVLREVRSGRCGPEREEQVLRAVYRDLEPADFSHGLLTRAAPWILALPLDGVRWCDWGRQDRIQQTLEQFRGVVLPESIGTITQAFPSRAR